ncbi:hypothetical protein AOLI_G00191770 [Acnodon oligacanthus]
MGSNGQDGPLILFLSLHLFLDVGDSSKSSIMRPLMPLCLSMLCLLLSTTPVAKAGLNTSATTASITSEARTHAAVVSTNAAEGPSSSAFHISTTPVTTQRKTESIPKNATTPVTPSQPTETTKTQQAKQSSGGSAVVILLFILVLIILLVIAFRWYKRNPDRRSFRGLWDSIVETAQLAWRTVMGCLQRPQNRAEGIEEDEEVVEMEAGGAEEEKKMEDGPKEEGAKQEEDNDSDSDSSLEEYSIVDAANLTEGEKQTGGEQEDRKSTREEGEETEEMTSVTLEDEEKAEPEEVDDLTPL